LKKDVTFLKFNFQNIEEDELNEELPENISEVLSDTPMDDGDLMPQFDLIQQTEDAEENGSSNFAFEDNLTSEQPSEEGKGEETNQTDDTIDRNDDEDFIADLAEENANSFPSADENYLENSNSNAVQESLDDDVQMIDDMSMDKTEDTYAQSDDVKNNDQHATDLDAENISEDELPAPTKPKVQDAEEVSDEELPGPKMAELPADTENVSEEELPASQTTNKKEKRKLQDYDPSEPTEENDAPEKKMKKDDGNFN
jgi:pre-mRNA-processing factor 39